MASTKAKKSPRLLVTTIAARSTTTIKPEPDYSDCVVLIPNPNAGKAAGANFLAVLFVNRVGVPKGVEFTAPSSAACYKVSTNTFFTPKGEIETALESAGEPGPPVIIK